MHSVYCGTGIEACRQMAVRSGENLVRIMTNPFVHRNHPVVYDLQVEVCTENEWEDEFVRGKQRATHILIEVELEVVLQVTQTPFQDLWLVAKRGSGRVKQVYKMVNKNESGGVWVTKKNLFILDNNNNCLHLIKSFN